MRNVTVLCVGKLKEGYWRDACREYEKRLRGYCSFSVMEVEEARCASNPNEAQIAQVLEAEGRLLLAKIPPQAFCAAMCIEGKLLDSPSLAKRLEGEALAGKSQAVFIIGGSFGLSDEVKRRADFKLSMSPMTFPHQLARVMVCEQLYRAFQINSGGKYHK